MLMVIGSRGWEHEQWQGSFYEELLPQDWHLKFYTRHFDVALAPAKFWLACSQDEIEEFCDDVEEDYPLIFESPDLTSATQQELLVYEMAKARVSTWVCFSGHSWTKQTSNYRITQAEILDAGKLRENAAVFTVSSSAKLSVEEIQQLMLCIKTEFQQFDVVYLFFDDALVDIDIMNTAITLLKILSLQN